MAENQFMAKSKTSNDEQLLVVCTSAQWLFCSMPRVPHCPPLIFHPKLGQDQLHLEGGV